MNEADVVAGGALANATGREPHPLLLEPGDRRGQVVHPEADVVQRRVVDLGPLVRLDRLQQIHLHLAGYGAGYRDVLVHVLRLAEKGSSELETEGVHPEAAERLLGLPTHCDRLHAENRKGAIGHREPPAWVYG